MIDILKGKKVLVAGAGGLLGAALVQKALKQGAFVIAADISVEATQRRVFDLGRVSNSKHLTFVELDLTNEAEVKAFFESQHDLTGAVNCTYPRNQSYGKHFLDVSLGSFNENLALHLGSSFLFMQQCAVLFLKEKIPFSLVNISSVYGVIAPKFEVYDNTNMTMPIEYAAIKSAIIHLNKYTAKYVKDKDFRVNSVSPGGILDNQPSEFLDAYKRETCGEGMLDVNDVVGSIIYLLSEQSKYVNGQNLVVDDGFSI